MKKRDRRFSQRKFEALAHYVVAKLGPIDEPTLCHALFQIDMAAYAEHGQSITGATYMKGAEHPIPCKRT